MEAGCNGAGSCPAPHQVSCPTGSCDGVLCVGDCAVDGDCVTGSEYCAAGVCTPLETNGAACSRDNMCISGRCVDGYCCNAGCQGQCEACDVAGSEGFCSAITDGVPHGVRQPCADDGTGCGGACDGVERLGCTYPDNQVECRSAACVSGVATLSGVCTGGGACTRLQQQTCDVVGCHSDGVRCGADCSEDSDCSGANTYCSAGICVDKEPMGAVCGSDDHCESGYCVDGVCCDRACSGRCEACNEPGRVGECALIIGSPRGRPNCGGVGVCAGVCDGSASDCVYPQANIECESASCSTGVSRSAGVCNGGGTCISGVETSCRPYQCVGSSCASGCSNASECAEGFDCVQGACTAFEPGSVGGAGGSGGGGGSAGAAGQSGVGGVSAGGAPGGQGGIGGTSDISYGGTSSGQGGASSLINADDEGSGCSLARGHRDPKSGMAWAVLGLAGWLILRRRHSALRSTGQGGRTAA